ncbi:MAG: hypothetical protein H8E55_68070 [Pelagibacterales bacterium]|nr:hypothetical protein [Pelagibacterales bacterium]
MYEFEKHEFEESGEKGETMKETPKSQVREQLELLEKSKSKLSKTICELEERLNPVLTPQSGDKDLVGDDMEMQLSPLASEIRRREIDTHLQNKHIRDIISRLTL